MDRVNEIINIKRIQVGTRCVLLWLPSPAGVLQVFPHSGHVSDDDDEGCDDVEVDDDRDFLSTRFCFKERTLFFSKLVTDS